MNSRVRENTQWITNILTSIGVIAAVVFSFYNTKVKPNEAQLQVSESKDRDYRKVVAYNGGQGLCVDFSISYPETMEHKYLFANYEETSLTNVKVSCNAQNNLCTSTTPSYQISTLSSTCENGVCKAFIGVLKPNESTAFFFDLTKDVNIKVSCVDQVVSSRN